VIVDDWRWKGQNERKRKEAEEAAAEEIARGEGL